MIIKCYQVSYVGSNDGVITLAQFGTVKEMTDWFNNRWREGKITLVVNITPIEEEP